jgi:C-terminal processing protease CtpA/Prc
MIKAGDQLVRVEGVEIRDMPPEQIGKMILGKQGSSVELGFVRGTERYSVQLIRNS